MVLRAWAAGSFVALASVGCLDIKAADDPALLGRRRDAIVGATGESTAAENFVVWLTRKETTKNCAGALVAPNLVLSTKQCLYEASTAGAICDASGEPAPGSVTGYITAAIPAQELVVFTGVSARKRWLDGVEAPDATGQKVIDDESLALCGHDLAFLVLDRPLTGVPIGRLRLGQRPEVGVTSPLVLAGWGKIDSGPYPATRMRRAGIGLQRVGSSTPIPGDTGSLVARTFETGPAACAGDVGGPAFDAATYGIVGVLSRGLNGVGTIPEECAAEGFVNVFMTVTDFPAIVRKAFKEANAEPWLENHDSAGFARFGDSCHSDLECEGDQCVGATTTSTGVCNVSCAKGGGACPDGYVCGASGSCEVPVPAPPPAPPANPSTPETEDDVVSASGGGCSVRACGSFARERYDVLGFGLAVVAACGALRRRLLLGRR